jgi:ribonucleases P/MRP protein subunit RPP40
VDRELAQPAEPERTVSRFQFRLGRGQEWCSQGSVLGTILFLIYINDIDDGISSRILKFTDDTKLYRKLETDGDIVQIQQDLANLFIWSRDWLILFNVEKCKVMHIGYNNVGASYMMNGTVLQDVKEEQDLGVVVHDNLKCAKQCEKVVTKANITLAMIKRNYSNFSDEVVLRICKSLVRPQLEYAVQAWRPYLKKDIALIEGVQRRATNLVHHLRGFQHEDRLRALHLTT